MRGSAGWITVEAAVGMAGTIVTSFVVARIIGPAEVGRAALAAAVVMLAQPIIANGFTNAVVQRPRFSDQDAASVLWAALGFALAMAVPFAAAGLLVPGWPGPGVGPVVAALAPVLALNAVEGTANGLLLRREDFRAMAVRGIAAHAVGLGTGLGLALGGAGAWAVVLQQLAYFATTAALSAAFAGLAPPFAPRAAVARETLRFAVVSAAGGITERAGFRLFLLAVASREPVLAGVLQIAFRIVEAARDLPQLFVHRFGLPALSRLRPDPAAFLRRLEASCHLVGLVFAPMFVGLALCAAELQSLILGPAWEGIVAPVQVLAAAFALTAPCLPLGVAFIAAGRPVVNLWLMAGSIALALLLTTLVPEGDAVAATAAWAATLVAGATAAGALAARCFGFAPARQARVLASALPPAAATATAILGMEASGLIPAAWPLAALLVKAAVGGVAGGVLLALLARRAWNQVSAPLPEAPCRPAPVPPRPDRRAAPAASDVTPPNPAGSAQAVPAGASSLEATAGRVGAERRPATEAPGPEGIGPDVIGSVA